jgi:hypothetical protein
LSPGALGPVVVAGVGLACLAGAGIVLVRSMFEREFRKLLIALGKLKAEEDP